MTRRAWPRCHRQQLSFDCPGGVGNAQLLVATYSSNQPSLSSASAPEPLPALSHACHNCNRHAANISANVGVSLSLYHGRCRCAWWPCGPDSAYQHTTSVATTQAIAADRPTPKTFPTCGAANPRNDMASAQ